MNGCRTMRRMSFSLCTCSTCFRRITSAIGSTFNAKNSFLCRCRTSITRPNVPVPTDEKHVYVLSENDIDHCRSITAKIPYYTVHHGDHEWKSQEDQIYSAWTQVPELLVLFLMRKLKVWASHKALAQKGSYDDHKIFKLAENVLLCLANGQLPGHARLKAQKSNQMLYRKRSTCLHYDKIYLIESEYF